MLHTVECFDAWGSHKALPAGFNLFLTLLFSLKFVVN